MAKAVSPIRLQSQLMSFASAEGALCHRSGAEQIEYWADLGRKVESVLDPKTLLAVKSGFSRISVERVEPVEVEPDAVFSRLNRKRKNGSLAKSITDGRVRYQASKAQPGMLERVSPDGTVETGMFVNGAFKVAVPA